jgi:hypothetical protein
MAATPPQYGQRRPRGYGPDNRPESTDCAFGPGTVCRDSENPQNRHSERTRGFAHPAPGSASEGRPSQARPAGRAGGAPLAPRFSSRRGCGLRRRRLLSGLPPTPRSRAPALPRSRAPALLIDVACRHGRATTSHRFGFHKTPQIGRISSPKRWEVEKMVRSDGKSISREGITARSVEGGARPNLSVTPSTHSVLSVTVDCEPPSIGRERFSRRGRRRRSRR